jgi:hypothetical protein
MVGEPQLRVFTDAGGIIEPRKERQFLEEGDVTGRLV